MSVFSFNFRENFHLSNMKNENEYGLMCLEFNKMVNAFYIKQELHSEKFWKLLEKEYKINNNDILSKTEIEVDEKNRIHKIYRVYVKCYITEKKYIMISFVDEDRNYDDEDYHAYTAEDEKTNKINDIVIYYDSADITTKKLEDTIVDKFLNCVYLPSMKNQFFTISTSQFGGYTLKVSYIKDIDIDLALNYGEKFPVIYDKIIYNLKSKKNGLFLFHGEPGAGKCVDGSTMVTLRNKKTQEIMNISINDFLKTIT